ncbi:MAG: hypothetical protein FJ267_00420, partial [Planctomycetes bacterium]|nr:hypothetical protein [Planctomycetota bacterium]
MNSVAREQAPVSTGVSVFRSGDRSMDVLVVLSIWVSLFIYGWVGAPIPATNEPHYLCKARHYWQTEWCENDFFLESFDTHVVFYTVFGFFLKWFSFEQVAVLGRLLATLTMAFGWHRLSTSLLIGRWSPMIATWIILAIASIGNFSGEWVFGGVEGKVFCYGFAFAALGQIARQRYLSAAGLLGIATSWHPVVGVWISLAVVGTWLSSPFIRTNVSFQSIVTGAILFAILSLPGLIPVVQLLIQPVEPEVKFAATYIQVFYRLAHHLDPMRFHSRAYLGYAVLILFWLSLLIANRNMPFECSFA